MDKKTTGELKLFTKQRSSNGANTSNDILHIIKNQTLDRQQDTRQNQMHIKTIKKVSDKNKTQ